MFTESLSFGWKTKGMDFVCQNVYSLGQSIKQHMVSEILQKCSSKFYNPKKLMTLGKGKEPELMGKRVQKLNVRKRGKREMYEKYLSITFFDERKTVVHQEKKMEKDLEFINS